MAAPGMVRDRGPAAAMLFAVLSKPIVTATSPSKLPNGRVIGAAVAAIVPPPGGKSPVSTKGGSVPTDASNALPLKVVAAVEVVEVFQAEARGIVEYTKSGTTVITTRSMRILEDFATFATP